MVKISHIRIKWLNGLQALFVAHFERKVPLFKISVTIPAEPWESFDRNIMFSRLEKANSGLNTINWRIWKHHNLTNKVIFSIGIDSESVNYLKDRQNRLYYGLGKLQFHFDFENKRE